MIAQKVSWGKLSASLGTDGPITRMWKKNAAKKVWARELLEEATRAVQLDTNWQDDSPYKEERELLRVSTGCSGGLDIFDVQLRGFLARRTLVG